MKPGLKPRHCFQNLVGLKEGVLNDQIGSIKLGVVLSALGSEQGEQEPKTGLQDIVSPVWEKETQTAEAALM